MKILKFLAFAFLLAPILGSCGSEMDEQTDQNEIKDEVLASESDENEDEEMG